MELSYPVDVYWYLVGLVAYQQTVDQIFFHNAMKNCNTPELVFVIEWHSDCRFIKILLPEIAWGKKGISQINLKSVETLEAPGFAAFAKTLIRAWKFAWILLRFTTVIALTSLKNFLRNKHHRSFLVPSMRTLSREHDVHTALFWNKRKDSWVAPSPDTVHK